MKLYCEVDVNNFKDIINVEFRLKINENFRATQSIKLKSVSTGRIIYSSFQEQKSLKKKISSNEIKHRKAIRFATELVNFSRRLGMVTHLDPIVNRNLVSGAIVQAEVSFLWRVFLVRLVPDYLHMNGDLLRRSTHEFVTAQSVRRIPALQRLDIFPGTLRAFVNELAISIVPHAGRLLRFLKRQLEPVMHHGAVLLRKELHDNIFSSRKDPWYVTLSAELGDLEDLSVHVLQQREIITDATGAPQFFWRSTLLCISVVRDLIWTKEKQPGYIGLYH